MSRPTDAARYAQADLWMKESFGESMPEYVLAQLRTPMTAAVREVRIIIKNAGARELLEGWRKEDALSNAGSKPIFSVTCALTLILLQVRLGRIPQVVSIVNTFHELTSRQRQDLDLAPGHPIEPMKSYDRIWEAIQRFILLVDEFYIPEGVPGARRKILKASQYARIIRMRDPERCERNRERMHELANMLLEATLRLMPAELLQRWEGNFAGDATVIGLYGKRGNPNHKDTTTDRRSNNFDGGYYTRAGSHAGYTKEDAAQLAKQGKKVQGSPLGKLVWGVEGEFAEMVPNITENRDEFPLLTVAVGFHIPGAITGSAAAMAQSIFARGHRLNYAIFDRAYPGGFVRDFHLPIRLMGGKLVFDYDTNEFGESAQDPRGFIQVVGSWFLDNLPQNLRNIDKPMLELRNQAKKPLSALEKAEKRHADAVKNLQSANQPGSPRDKAAALDEFKEATAELDEVTKEHKQLLIELRRAEATYEKQLLERRKYRLKPKGGIKANGTRQYIVPDTSKIPFAKPQRYTQKTVLIAADITADKNPGGLRREQHLEYGFDFWRQVYAKRNGVEALNRNVKRSQYEAIADADRRHVRGNTFTYVVVTLAVVCQNIRQILNFLKERLAIRPLSPKNSDIWVNFWEPEPRSEEVDPPHRC